MALPCPDLDIEAQTNSVTGSLPVINIQCPSPTTHSVNLQPPTTSEPQPQHTNPDQLHYENAAARKATDNSGVQRDENHGDSSDGLWWMYLTEAEKQDKEVTESWKGDTDGILVFTGLFSATVATFIIESYHNLSPNSSDTTNALLTQISQQLAHISNGTALTSVAAQRGQPFTPTRSAIRVNVLWFLSLVLSLSCALSATLMQQWARRYRELAQRRGAFHRRGRMRAYIFDGVNRFGMARAVATMPTLLHISVFLFFAGLVEFLFPIQATVACATLSYIMLFALAYAILTVLPNIYHSCPYDTPLSGLTWRISHFSVIGFHWTTLKIESLFHKPLSKLLRLANQPAPEPDGLKSWRETLESQVEIRRQRLSQGMRKGVEHSAYRAESTVVTSALEWTLTALDEDKEIEDFSLRIPGFFDSRVVPDATLAVLPLMSHQPNTVPIFGSRLYDLIKTCVPETLSLDEEMRKNRLRACMRCLWSFAKAYNQVGPSQELPSYFPYALASPEITRFVQAEEDLGIRVIGRCFGALIVNKLAVDLESRTDSISDEELACLSAILGNNSHDVKLFLSLPGTVALLNMISLSFDEIDILATDTGPSGAWNVAQQTLGILSQAVSPQENADVQLNRPINIIDGSGTNFGSILEYRILDLLDTCLQVTSPIEDGVRTSCLRVCLKGLWCFGRSFNQFETSMPLPSFSCVALTNPEMIHRIHEQHDLTVRVLGRCVEALVVNKLAADIKSRNHQVTGDELACLSAILGTKSHDVMLLLDHPGAIEFTNMIFLASGSFASASARVPSDVPGVVQETFGILSRALPADFNATIPLDQTATRMNVFDGFPSLTTAMYGSVLRVWMDNLWPFARKYNEPWISAHMPSYVCISFINPEMTRRIREERDLAVRTIGHCVGALVVNKLAADIKSLNHQATGDELRLACLSSLLGIKSDDVTLLLSFPGAVEFTTMVFLALDNSHSFTHQTASSDVLEVVQETFGTLSRALPAEWNAVMSLDLTDTPMSVSDGASVLTDTMYRSILYSWMKNLWSFTRGYTHRENAAPLPPYVFIAFANPEMTRRIREEPDLAIRVIGRCVEALVVNKLAADIKSRGNPASKDELACISAILGTKSDNVKLLLNHLGAIEFTNLLFLVLDDFYALTSEVEPSYVLNVVEATFSFLSRALPSEFNANIRLNKMGSVTNVADGTSSLTAEMYRSVLREWMKKLWSFTTAYNPPWSSEPLPSYVCIAFTNPEMTRRIREQRDLAVRVIGRCVEALVVNSLAANIMSRNAPVSNEKLRCLTVILGTKSDDVKLLLNHPGAIEFTKMVFLALDNFHSFAHETVPMDVLDVVQESFGILSRALPAEWSIAMLLDQTDTLMNTSDGTSSMTVEETYRTALHVWMKNLWFLTREYNKPSNLAPLPSYLCVSFANPEMNRRICEERDLPVRVLGRCIEALVVNKLATDIKSSSHLVGNDDLPTCLRAILGTKSNDVELSPNHLGAIKFTKMVFLALDNFYSFTDEILPSDIPNVVQETFGILSRALPVGFNAVTSLAQTDSLVNLSHGASSLTTETYRSILREWMENLWRFIKACNEDSAPLPSYVCITFANPEMTHRIREQRDLAVRVIGRCVEALVVNKLTADIKSRGIPVSSDELACISAIVGTKSDNVKLLLDHPGATEFTNMVFLALDDFYSFTLETMPLYVLEVVQETFSALSQALPPELNTKMRPKQTASLIGVSDSTSSLTAAMYQNVLRVWMKSLWHFTRECNKPGNSVPLPSYVCVAFTNPEITRRIREERDLAVRGIGRCIGALIANKLVADINSRNALVNRDDRDDELACLSTILGTNSHEVSLCLGQPGTIELVILASLALGDVSSLRADQQPPDTRSVFKKTFAALFQSLTDQGNARLALHHTIALVDVSEDEHERTLVNRLNDLLTMCVSGASALVEEVRTSNLRMCLKTLWHCAKAYHQIPDPMPSYFPRVLATPEIIRRIQTEHDTAVRIIGCCFGALIASKLVDALEPPISLSGPIHNAEIACISAILGIEHRDDILSPHQLHLINFRNVVSLMSSKIDTLFTSEGMPADLLTIAQDTLYVIANSLRDSMFVLGGLPKNQSRLLQEMYSDVEHALSSDQLKNETLRTLDRLRRILGKLLPGVDFTTYGNTEPRLYIRNSLETR